MCCLCVGFVCCGLCDVLCFDVDSIRCVVMSWYVIVVLCLWCASCCVWVCLVCICIVLRLVLLFSVFACV